MCCLLWQQLVIPVNHERKSCGVVKVTGPLSRSDLYKPYMAIMWMDSAVTFLPFLQIFFPSDPRDMIFAIYVF